MVKIVKTRLLRPHTHPPLKDFWAELHFAIHRIMINHMVVGFIIAGVPCADISFFNVRTTYPIQNYIQRLEV